MVASSWRNAKHFGGVAVLDLPNDRDCDWAVTADHPMAMAMTSQHDNPKRWRPRITIRELLLCTLVVALALEWWNDKARLIKGLQGAR